MFRVKICGVTSPEDAEDAVRAGADAVGVNFHPGSARYVPPERAAPILEALEGKALAVGVFVNEGPARVGEICRELGIGVVQLSGHEPAEDAASLPFRRLKAVHLADPAGILRFRGYPCEAFLLDAAVPGRYGGTGVRLDWKSLGEALRGPTIRFGEEPGGMAGIPWILAGGLTPDNVEEAIRLARPHGVDVAGGVEREPGRKDPDRVRRFVHHARRGFERAGIPW